MFEYKKRINLFFLISFCILFISTAAGSLYFIKVYGADESVKAYMDNYTESVREGMDMQGIVKSSILSNSIIFLAIFLSSYFNIGYIFSVLVCIRKGFVDGFTVSAINSVYGLNGLHLYTSYIPQALITIPLICLYWAVSAVFSKNRREINRKTNIIYIIFSMVVFTIFCVSCILEGLLTTTFAKWLALKVT